MPAKVLNNLISDNSTKNKNLLRHSVEAEIYSTYFHSRLRQF